MLLAIAGACCLLQTERQARQARRGSSSNAGAPPPSAPLLWSCSDEALLVALAARDPLAVGLEGRLALRLLQRLLAWQPSQRPTAAQALRHAYFRGGGGGSGRAVEEQLRHCSLVGVGEPGWC